MVYKKRTKRRYPKTNYYPRASSALSLASKALYVAKQTKSLINVERKFIDIAETVSPSTAGNIRSLIEVATGTTNTTREGNSIKLVSLLFRYYMGINQSATNTTLRVMLVCDKQANQAQFTLSGLLQDSSAQKNIISPLFRDRGQRFRVLYSQLH